jgi:hypothetical protein
MLEFPEGSVDRIEREWTASHKAWLANSGLSLAKAVKCNNRGGTKDLQN